MCSRDWLHKRSGGMLQLRTHTDCSRPVHVYRRTRTLSRTRSATLPCPVKSWERRKKRMPTVSVPGSVGCWPVGPKSTHVFAAPVFSVWGGQRGQMLWQREPLPLGLDCKSGIQSTPVQLDLSYFSCCLRASRRSKCSLQLYHTGSLQPCPLERSTHL